MKKNIFYILSMILLWTTTHAQDAVYLNARTIETATDFDVPKTIAPTDTEVFNNKCYRLVQFNRLPMPSEKAEMMQNGIEILDYIPSQAFVLSFPLTIGKGFYFSFLSKFDVKTVIILRGSDKMSDGLRMGNFPDFAQKVVGKLDLNVQPYANVTLEQTAIDLQKRGFETIGLPNSFFKTITIRVKKADVERVASLPYVRFIDFIDGAPQQEDEKSNTVHRGNTINTDGKTGLKYDGTGFGISYADDGPVGPHIDFQGRLIQVENRSSNGDVDHADATAGAGAAAGNLDPALKSGASGATVVSQIIDTYPQIQNAVANQVTYKAYVTSTSYGQGIPGSAFCNVYDGSSSSIDAQAFANPKLFHVFSAGNSGAGTCIGVPNFGNITGGYKLGKNLVTVGNVDVADRLAASSSRGPSVDGRIKPDICAVGMSVYTTQPNNKTTTISGTSFSCPATAAAATQLYHAFSDLNGGQIPDAALIKAVMMNTADDLGNPGPDFNYGWGRLNVWRAYKTLKDKKYIKSSVYRTDSIKTFAINLPAGVKLAKVMLYWHDHPGTPNTSRALVNDLDLTVKSIETGRVLLPWVLNTTRNADSLGLNATRGKDRVNNVEQVVIDTADLPALGTTTLELTVNGFHLPRDSQSFYLVYEFNKQEVAVTYPNGNEAIAAGTAETIHWEALGTEGSFAVDFSNDGGVTWSGIAASVPGNLRSLRWNVPDEATGKACVRVRQILENTIISDLSDELFTVSRLANKLTVKYVCLDSTYLSFDTVPGAKAYQICRLGAKYMDSILTTSLNLVAVPIKWTDSAWFSVRPILSDGGLGRRVNAIQKPRSLTVCPGVKDLQALRMVQNMSGTFYTCHDGFERPLSIWVKNYSFEDIDSFRIGYQVGTNTAVQSVVRLKIKSNDSLLYVLPQNVRFPSLGAFTFKVWTKLDGDTNPSNDTLSTDIVLSEKFRTPLVETFDNKPFPPNGFQVASSFGLTTWTKATNVFGSDGQQTTTAIFEGQLYPTRGVKDTLLTWLCDLTGLRNPQLSFDVSFQLYSLFRSPNLSVVASTDCGRSFNPTTYSKTRFDLATNTATGQLWQPSLRSHWRRDTVSLAAYKDSVVMLGLVFYPDNDNRIYIDNINIENNGPTATENTPLSMPMLTAFPNPSKDGIFTLIVKNFDAQALTVKVFDARGKQVLQKNIGQVVGDWQEPLNLQHQPAGVYLMQVQTDKKVYSLIVIR
jgi:hypothetical protein